MMPMGLSVYILNIDVDRNLESKWRFKRELFDSYLIYTRLCMGPSSSPYIFSHISDFIGRYAAMEGVVCVINYLSDFCLIGNS